ncbi:MAG: transcriptional regulator [Bacteroidetes bacterium]|nr:transcriptional regulator [Bacteroidota bacterium]
MQVFHIDRDIPVVRVAATAFPEGVMAAHQSLHQHFSAETMLNYYGISQGGPADTILYWAAAELVPGEDGQKPGLESFVLSKGRYVGQDISDYMQHPMAISQCFEDLLKHPELDPAGYCLEWYITRDMVRCMVKLK